MAQNVDSIEVFNLRNEVEILSASNASLKATVNRQGVQVEASKKAIEELYEKIADNSMEIKSVSSELCRSIDSVSSKVIEQDNILKTKTELMTGQIRSNAILFGLCGCVLLLLTAVVFLFARLNIKSTQKRVDVISNDQRLLKDDNIKLDNKLLDILEHNIKQGEQKIAEPNHKLAVNIANEVARISQNLTHMDESVKGVSNLKHRVDAILTFLNSQGYDIPLLLGKPYNEGYNMIATMEQDDSLKEGEQIIKRVIKPQISFNGKMIQAAEVVVAYNE